MHAAIALSMALFQLRWLRRLIRNNTSPIPMKKAEIWKRRFAVLYMFASFNLLGTIFYYYYKGTPDLAAYYGLKPEDEINKKPAIYYAELLGVKNAHVIRYKGFNKVEEFDYVKEADKEQVKTDME